MDAVNAGMKGLFDVLWTPFAAAPLWFGLLVLGVAFGVVALLAMKYTTNQKRVEHFKDRYQGHILAIKLFRDALQPSVEVLVGRIRDDVAAGLLRPDLDAEGVVSLMVGAYLGEQFKPMLVMLVPFMLLFAQMQMRLGYRPLDVGAPVLLTIDLAPGLSAEEMALEFALPAGLETRAKMVREPSENRVVVPIAATAAGAHLLKLTCGGETVEKLVHAGPIDGAPMVMPVRSNDFFDQLLYPGEDSFGSSSKFRRISLAYPVRPIDCFGLDLSFGSEIGMAMTFVLITIIAAFGLKGVFGVTI